MPVKAGPLTLADFRAIWESATDKGYSAPLKSAGDGGGMEAWSQLFAQFERASKAIDVTTQAMFISSWSGQTNPPAAGARRATVTLKIARSKRLEEPLLLGAGLVCVAEETTDWGDGGGEVVRTGRRYFLNEDLFFAPGEQGPFEVEAIAEFEGYGFDNPLPNTISAFDQTGSRFENDLATVAQVEVAAVLPGGSYTRATLVADNSPDMFVPEHVGQYVAFLSGANSGRVARAVEFLAPALPAGSGVALERLYSVGASPSSGTFSKGEVVQIGGGTAYGRVVDDRIVAGKKVLSFVLLTGPGTAAVVGAALLGLTSGATGTIWTVGRETSFVAEAPSAGVGGARWRVLDWVADWGLAATHELSPSGGRAAFLDDHGDGRGIGRTPGEPDESYRPRVREIADVVSPNAIRRQLNRALGGYAWCLREVGSRFLPGFFFDGTNEPPQTSPHGAANDAWDTDTIAFTGTVTTGTFRRDEPVVLENPTTLARYATGRFGRLLDSNTTLRFVRSDGAAPASVAGLRIRGLWSEAQFSTTAATPSAQANSRRNRVWLDYEQFRGFFVVSLPPLGLGEFGFSWDSTGLRGAWDSAGPFDVFFDGYPRSAGDIYLRAWNSLEQARAAGVVVELRRDGGSCP